MKKDIYNLDFSDKTMDDMEHLAEELLNNPEYKEILNSPEYKNKIEEIEDERELAELREKEKNCTWYYMVCFVFRTCDS